MADIIRKKLEANGVIEERIVSTIIEKFTSAIRGPDGGSSLNVPRMTYLINSWKCRHERNPVLVTSLLELKLTLQTLAAEFGLTN